MTDETLRSVDVERTGLGRYLVRNVRGGTIQVSADGDDSFTPVELLLAAIGACTGADVDYVTSRRAEPDGFTVRVTGDKLRIRYGAQDISPHDKGAYTGDVSGPMLAKLGCAYVLVGHSDHEEVQGTLGEAPHAIDVVEHPADVDRLQPPDPQRVAFLTQTTLALDEVQEVVDRLRERFPAVVGPSADDVCYATQNRQEAVKELADEARVVLVLGSQNSSNSNRLAEIARTRGKSAHLIDTVKELRYRNPARLAEAMAEANKRRKLVRFLPSEKLVTRWVEHAKRLPQKITYR